MSLISVDCRGPFREVIAPSVTIAAGPRTYWFPEDKMTLSAERATARLCGRTRDAYLALRRAHEPESIRLIIVAESPPASGRYFYDSNGSVREPLFRAFMQYLGLDPLTKDEGLRALQEKGWVLVDATYKPVNELDASSRDRVIVDDYALLCADLTGLTRGRSVPLVLIKANICRVLEPLLVADGYGVLNRGRAIYFFSPYRVA